MSPRSKRITRAAAIAALGLACSQRTRRTPDDTLVLLNDSAPTTSDPRNARTNIDTKLSHLVAAGLTTIDTPDAAPELLLAERIDRIDDLTYDVTLRPGLLF